MRGEESGNGRPGPWSSAGVWLLAALGLLGLVGFVVVFGVLLGDTGISPQAATPVTTPSEAPPVVGTPGPPGKPGPRGERGLAGPPGPRGDPGIRIVRHQCSGGNCTVQCENDEMLLTAHCGIGRTPAVYPTAHSALCRSRGTAKVETVAACVKYSP